MSGATVIHLPGLLIIPLLYWFTLSTLLIADSPVTGYLERVEFLFFAMAVACCRRTLGNMVFDVPLNLWLEQIFLLNGIWQLVMMLYLFVVGMKMANHVLCSAYRFFVEE